MTLDRGLQMGAQQPFWLQNVEIDIEVLFTHTDIDYHILALLVQVANTLCLLGNHWNTFIICNISVNFM